MTSGWSIAVDRGDDPSSDWWLPRCEEISGFFATVRQDTREVLGIVGERYRIVQNHEAFAFIDQLLGSSIHFETAGSLQGGRRVWVLATLPDHVEVGGGAVRPYVLLMNSHDGSTAVIAATTPVRVVTGEMLVSVWPELAWAPIGLRVASYGGSPRASGLERRGAFCQEDGGFRSNTVDFRAEARPADWCAVVDEGGV
jgi:Domain of unknown function (DUF932)